MLDDAELALVLASLPRDMVTRVRLLIASGWPLEAERILSDHLGDPLRGKEIAASLIRKAVRS